YEVYGTSPVALPWYVAVNGDDAWDGRSPTHPPGPGTSGPKQTIQAALNAAAAGDTVLVSPGSYSGANNRGFDFRNKTLMLRCIAGAATTTINCEGAAPGVSSEFGPPFTLDGFTITNGASNSGAAFLSTSRALIRNCLFLGNTAYSGAGGL